MSQSIPLRQSTLRYYAKQEPPTPARVEPNFWSVPHGPSGHPQNMKTVRCAVD